jgi:hypothetical protein
VKTTLAVGRAREFQKGLINKDEAFLFENPRMGILDFLGSLQPDTTAVAAN